MSGHRRISRQAECTGELLLDIFLQSPQNKWPHNRMQPGNKIIIETSIPFNHMAEWVAEPIGEFLTIQRLDQHQHYTPTLNLITNLSGSKQMRHQKMHEGPELHEIILQWCAGQQ